MRHDGFIGQTSPEQQEVVKVMAKSFYGVITQQDGELSRGTKVHIGPNKTEMKNGKGVVSFTFDGTPADLLKQLIGRVSKVSVLIEDSPTST